MNRDLKTRLEQVGPLVRAFYDYVRSKVPEPAVTLEAVGPGLFDPRCLTYGDMRAKRPLLRTTFQLAVWSVRGGPHSTPAGAYLSRRRMFRGPEFGLLQIGNQEIALMRDTADDVEVFLDQRSVGAIRKTSWTGIKGDLIRQGQVFGQYKLPSLVRSGRDDVYINVALSNGQSACVLWYAGQPRVPVSQVMAVASSTLGTVVSGFTGGEWRLDSPPYPGAATICPDDFFEVTRDLGDDERAVLVALGFWLRSRESMGGRV